MARKTFVDLSDTLNAFRVKTNVISFNVGDLDSLHSSLPDSDLVQAINHLRLTDSSLRAAVDSNQTQIFNNDSDIAALNLFAGIGGGGGTSLQTQINEADSNIGTIQTTIGLDSNGNPTSGGGGGSLQAQITANDSDILALQTAIVRPVQLSILKSDGSLVKRIFGFADSGD